MISSSAADAVVAVTALGVGGLLLFYRPLAASSAWRATVTPLASIMGSGFLVCAPLLYAHVGNAAFWAMAGLLVLAYGVGSVIRFNIRYGEPLLERLEPPKDGRRPEHRMHVGHRNAGQRVGNAEALELFEKASHLALSCAYCISVSYYLQLLASFALAPLGWSAAWPGKVLCTLILAGIGAVGALRGLGGLERVERVVVGLNLAMIAALLAGLAAHNGAAVLDGTWGLAGLPVRGGGLHDLRLLMGLLIVVQGFETSRYLGSEHPAEERVRTMRWAQLLSSAIYLLFIAFMALVINRGDGGGGTGITAIVGYSGIVAPILPLLVTVTAIGSQFSAATADDAGCSGLLESMWPMGGRVQAGYLVVSAVSVTLTWLTDVYQIISVASRAFALYYALQCLVALMVARRTPGLSSSRLRTALFAGLAVVCAAVTLFGISAE